MLFKTDLICLTKKTDKKKEKNNLCIFVDIGNVIQLICIINFKVQNFPRLLEFSFHVNDGENQKHIILNLL